MDATGLHALEELLDKCAREGTTVVLSGVHAQPMTALERSGLLERIGRENLAGDFESAVARAKEIAAS